MVKKLSNIIGRIVDKTGLKRLISPKVGGLCGVLGPIIGLTFIGAAIYFAPWFSWTDNYLSDLAGDIGERPIWSALGKESLIFNFGLIIAGIMGIVFAANIREIPMLDTPLGRLGTLLFFLDMVALCAVGIFPKTTGFPHAVASVSFFLLVPLYLLFIGTVVRRSPEKTLGWFITLLGVIALCLAPLFVIPRPWGSNAIAEIFPAILMAVFAMIFGTRLLKGKFEF